MGNSRLGTGSRVIGMLLTASLLSVLPPLIFAPFAQRYLAPGPSAGAVTG